MLFKRILIIFLVATGLLMTAVPYWLLATQPGLRFVLDRTFSMLELPITYKNLNGSVLTSIKADNVRYSNDTVTIDIEQFQTGFDLLPLLASTINFHDVGAAQVDVRLNSQSSDPQKEPQPTNDNSSTSSGLPVTIAIDGLSVNRLNVSTGEDEPLQFSSVKIYTADIQQGFDFEEWQIGSRWGEIKTSGFLAFNNSDKNKLSLDWSSHAVNNIPAMQGKSRISGNYSNLQIQTDISAPVALKVEATVNELFNAPQWSATATSQQLPLSIMVPSSGTVFRDIKLDTKGTLQHYWIDIKSKIADAKYGEWMTEMEGQVADQQVDIKRLYLKSLHSPAIVNAAGSVQMNAEEISQYPVTLAMSWNDIQWPPVGDSMISKANGNLSATGKLASYQYELDNASLIVAEQQLSAISARGNGTLDSLQVTTISANYLQGMWQGESDLDWSDAVKVNTRLKADNVDPSVNWSQWPGKLSTSISAQGEFKESGWIVSGKLHKLSGALAGYKISKSAVDFSLSDNDYQFNNLVFYSDNNNISGSFRLTKPEEDIPFVINSRWKADIRNLSQLFPEAKGSITSHGRFDGPLELPNVELEVAGENLQYQTYKIASLEANVLANLPGDGKLDVNAVIKQAEYDNNEISNVNLKVTGTTYKHKVAMGARFSDGQVMDVDASGGYRDNMWKGQLSSVDLDLLKYGNWHLRQPSDIVLAKDQAQVTTLCLAEKAHRSVVCNELMMSHSSSWVGKTTVANFAVENLNAWMPPYINTVDGDINGKIAYEIVAGEIKTLEGKLSSTTGQFVYDVPTREKQVQQYRGFLLSVAHTDKGVSVTSGINLMEAGRIKSQIDLLNLHHLQRLDLNQEIRGELLIDLNSLILLPAVFPELQYVEGRKTSRFKISGTINDPLITGSSHLEVKTVSIPAIGLKLSDVDLTVVSSSQRNLTIDGKAKSGDGSVKITGELVDYKAAKLVGKLSIKGDNFRAAQTPEITVDVSPDLQFTLDGDRIDMQGVIFIPRAEIKMLDSASSLQISSDVVLVDQEGVKEKTSTFQLNATIRIKLGDRVTIEGYGASGKLQGEILVQEKPGELTIATGELRIVDGKYNAYGTELSIAKGHIIYASVPITNPAIDIEARRKIDDEIWAGVSVTGKANNPQIQLASEPAMDDSDILSYIMLGRPISQASREDGSLLTSAAASLGLVGGETLVKQLASEFGIDEVSIQSDQTTQQTSMVLGKYLSPHLYAKYAIGIGQAVNTLQIEYKITSRWILRTETGGEGEGADFLYRIETD